MQTLKWLTGASIYSLTYSLRDFQDVRKQLAACVRNYSHVWRVTGQETRASQRAPPSPFPRVGVSYNVVRQ